METTYSEIMKTINFKVSMCGFDIEITSKKIEYILSKAFLGGSNYWIDYEGQIEIKLDSIFLNEKIPNLYVWQYPLYNLGVIKFIENLYRGTEDEQVHKLTYQSLIEGAKNMARKYPRHFKDWINGHDDSITADVYLQCCLFEEIVYGEAEYFEATYQKSQGVK